MGLKNLKVAKKEATMTFTHARWKYEVNQNTLADFQDSIDEEVASGITIFQILKSLSSLCRCRHITREELMLLEKYTMRKANKL